MVDRLPGVAEIALAWLLAQKQWIVPIPGTKKLARVDENLGAAAVEVAHDELREVESAASHITVQGARYPEHLEEGQVAERRRRPSTERHDRRFGS